MAVPLPGPGISLPVFSRKIHGHRYVHRRSIEWSPPSGQVMERRSKFIFHALASLLIPIASSGVAFAQAAPGHPLGQVSASICELTRRVSPTVVGIFMTGCDTSGEEMAAGRRIKFPLTLSFRKLSFASRISDGVDCAETARRRTHRIDQRHLTAFVRYNLGNLHEPPKSASLISG
jgi:hypothetical protein